MAKLNKRRMAKLSSDGGLILVWNSCWKSRIQAKQTTSRHQIAGSLRFVKDMVYLFVGKHTLPRKLQSNWGPQLPSSMQNYCAKEQGECTQIVISQTWTRLHFHELRYDAIGAKEVWCASASSGLDKRQCTVQLTIFADGVPRVRPTIIFRGKGKRISANEKSSWDRRVNLMFQPKAWCDESVMKVWVEHKWGNVFTDPPRAGSSGKILVADVQRAQQTNEVKKILQKKKTLLINVPPGSTSRVQPLGVSLNKPFKNAVKIQFEKNLQENLTMYVRRQDISIRASAAVDNMGWKWMGWSLLQ